MHLLNTDPDLSFLTGRKVTSISISQYQVILVLENSSSMDSHISVEGNWCLKDKDGRILDERIESDNRGESKLPLLLTEIIEKYEVVSQNILGIKFKSYTLELACEESPYENFQIHFGKHVVVY